MKVHTRVYFSRRRQKSFYERKRHKHVRFGMNVQNTTCGVSCDALRHTFSDVSYYSRC